MGTNISEGFAVKVTPFLDLETAFPVFCSPTAETRSVVWFLRFFVVVERRRRKRGGSGQGVKKERKENGEIC